MRYKNHILSKGDKVKLKPYSDDWLPSMTKNYGGKVVTIKDFIYNFGFVCEPLGDDVASYMFDVNDIDEVVYRKNNEDKIKKYEIKKGLKCCAAVGLETGCSDCPYRYRCGALYRDALNIITNQEKEIEQLTEERNLVKEFAEQLKIEAIRLPAIENYHVCNLIDELLKEYGE